MAETTPHVPPLFYLFAILALLYFAYNLRKLAAVRIGQKDERPLQIISQFINGLIWGIGQWRVYSLQFVYASVMHFFLGWGFIELTFATTVDFFITRGWLVQFLPVKDTPWFAAMNDLGGFMLLLGILMALFRRHVNKPEPLPQHAFKGRGNFLGDTGILLLLLLLVIGGFLAEAARLAIEHPETSHYSWLGYPISQLLVVETWRDIQPGLWWSHAILSLLFIAILPLTKMFHAIVVIVNIALTNRSERGNLRPMYVTELLENPDADSDEIILGASKAEEFTWKQLLDSVACTECSRCTIVCPAYNTGKPLSPMKIITDIRHNLYATKFGSNESKPLIDGSLAEIELWSCTTCGACMEVCPVLIDHVPTFTDMRRYLVLSEGKPPSQAIKTLENILQYGNPWGLPRNDRTKWAASAGINLPIMTDKHETDVLYWIGCAGAYDPRNQRVTKSMIKIFESADVDFGVLGNEEMCTGDSARRMGEESLFETMAMQNIETLNRYKFNTIVTACPHCFHTINNEYHDFDGNYKVVHHSEFIHSLIKEEKLRLNNQISDKITYHDACYLGRHNKIYESPRDIIKTMIDGGELVEMKRNRENSFCCGAGGGNMWYDIEEGSRINLARFKEATDTGASIISTACSFCMIMLDDAMKVEGKEESIQLKDIAELVADNLS